ncbi:MAG: flavodoxin domain-containing protein [Desulfomonilaceae bacterium]
MPKVLIAYATRNGETKNIAELIAEGVRFTGVEANVLDANALEAKFLTHPEDLADYDAYIFGSPTYHGEMMQAMKTLLFLAAQVNLEGKTGGSFGAYGWSGEAADRIYDTMQNVFRMDMVGSPLKLKSASLQGGLQMAQDYGRAVGQKVSGK